MYRYQCSLLWLFFSMSSHKIIFYASCVKEKAFGFQFSKEIFLMCTHVLPQPSIYFKRNRACVPQENCMLVSLVVNKNTQTHQTTKTKKHPGQTKRKPNIQLKWQLDDFYVLKIRLQV